MVADSSTCEVEGGLSTTSEQISSVRLDGESLATREGWRPESAPRGTRPGIRYIMARLRQISSGTQPQGRECPEWAQRGGGTGFLVAVFSKASRLWSECADLERSVREGAYPLSLPGGCVCDGMRNNLQRDERFFRRCITPGNGNGAKGGAGKCFF